MVNHCESPCYRLTCAEGGQGAEIMASTCSMYNINKQIMEMTNFLQALHEV